TTSPERKCKITVDIEGHHYGEFSATDYFACLDAIRNQLTDVIFHCHGARIDTYPSGMSRDMGSGMAVYCMKMGQPLLKENVKLLSILKAITMVNFQQQIILPV
ncbi:hypothetical protein, partial [Shigella sp. FC1967]|uniref:hypothetical protein n=1 Tax=Shigella sp. FC1967 TaxID=1898041 RepID=UPI001C0A70F3